MIRGVVFPYSRGGVAAAVILGFGRAIGEAIAVAQVIGAFTGISVNLFHPGNTLGANIALNAQGASSGLETSSLIYCGLILLVFSIVVNLLAQWIVRRGARRQGLAR
jgi:phosphate transport system permease protein